MSAVNGSLSARILSSATIGARGARSWRAADRQRRRFANRKPSSADLWQNTFIAESRADARPHTIARLRMQSSHRLSPRWAALEARALRSRCRLYTPKASPLHRPARRPPRPPHRARRRVHGRDVDSSTRVSAGWFRGTDRADPKRYAKDLLDGPIIRAINRTFPLWVLAGLLIPLGLGVALTPSHMGRGDDRKLIGGRLVSGAVGAGRRGRRPADRGCGRRRRLGGVAKQAVRGPIATQPAAAKTHDRDSPSSLRKRGSRLRSAPRVARTGTLQLAKQPPCGPVVVLDDGWGRGGRAGGPAHATRIVGR